MSFGGGGLIPPVIVDIVSRAGAAFAAGVDDAKARIDEIHAPPVDLTADPAGVVEGVEESKGALDDLQAKSAETAAATREDAEASGGAFEGMGGAVKMAFFGAGAAIAGAAYEGVKGSVAFDTAMTQLVTGAGEAQKNIGMISSGIEAMAGQVGQAPINLAHGIYMIESAGYHGAAALDVLRSSAEGAATGGADMATVSDAVTTAMHDYAIPVGRANAVTNALIQTVALGKTHLGDLSRSLGSVLPTAAALGVKFQDVTGAMATMTVGGTTARRAAQNLAFTLQALGAPSTTTATTSAFAAAGISAQRLHDILGTQGLSAALDYVREQVATHFPQGSVAAVQAFKTIMGGATGYRTALLLTGKSQATFAADSASVGKVLDGSAKSVQGYSKVQQDLGFKFEQLKATLSGDLVKVGAAITPAITAALPAITSALSALMSAIAPILKGVMPAITSAIASLAPVVTGVIKELMPALAPVLRFAGLFLEQFGQVAGRVLTDFAPTFVLLGHALGVVFDALERSGVLNVLGKALEQIAPMLASLVDQLLTALLPMLPELVKLFSQLVTMGVQTLESGLQKLMPVAAQLIREVLPPLIPLLQELAPLLELQARLFGDGLKAALAITVPLLKVAADALGWVVTAAKNALGWVEGLVSGIVNAIPNAATQALNFGKSIYRGIINGIGSLVSDVAGVISNTAASVWDAATTAFTDAVHFGEQIVKGVLHGLESLPGDVLHLIEKIPIVGGVISDVFGAASHTPAGPVAGAVKAIPNSSAYIPGSVPSSGPGSAPETPVQMPGRGVGLTINGGITINGKDKPNAQVVDELYQRLVPYLHQPAY